MNKDQIELLADYIVANCPREIIDGGAGDVAIRVIGRMAKGIEDALSSLLGAEHVGGGSVAVAVALLQDALGQWGPWE